MNHARDAVLARVREALHKTGDRSAARAAAEAYLAARAQGPRPRIEGDLVARFTARARQMASTVERIAELDALPRKVARYLDALELPPAVLEAEPVGIEAPHRGGLLPAPLTARPREVGKVRP